MVGLEEPPPRGRPTVPADIRTQIRTMAQPNPAGVRHGSMANY
jgi:hypothetical protein